MSPKPAFTLFGIRYLNTYTPGPFATQIINGKYASLLPRTLDTYANRPRTGLWISVFSNTANLKKVIRAKASRKVRTAFAEALAERGYSAKGLSVDGSGSVTAATDGGRGDLVGSIVFYPTLYLEIVERGEVLGREMRDLVGWLESGPVEKGKSGLVEKGKSGALEKGKNVALEKGKNGAKRVQSQGRAGVSRQVVIEKGLPGAQSDSNASNRRSGT